MRQQSGSKSFIPVAAREVVLLCLGTGIAVYAVYTHDHDIVVYGFSLLCLGVIPFSVVDRYLTLRFGGGFDENSPHGRPQGAEKEGERDS